MDSKFKYYLILVPLVLTIILKAQVNIVTNASFENYEYCPTQFFERFENILDNGWFSSLGSPDYFNPCSGIWERQVPINSSGNQNAHSGNGYIGFYLDYIAHSIPANPYPLYYYNQLREISGIKLKYKLTKDSIYTIGFYVSLADTFAFSIKNWGCMFSKDSLYIDAVGSLQAANQVNDKFIADTSLLKVDLFPDSILKNIYGWTKVETTFKAKGGEQYMYIGCFIQPYDIIWEPSPNIGNIDTTIDGLKAAYYYIDDVYLYGDTNYKAVGIKENIFEQIKVYPNPANDILTLNIGDLKNIQLELFDISGRKLFLQTVNTNQENIDVSSLAYGVYICTITSNNQIVKREKVIIQR